MSLSLSSKAYLSRSLSSCDVSSHRFLPDGLLSPSSLTFFKKSCWLFWPILQKKQNWKIVSLKGKVFLEMIGTSKLFSVVIRVLCIFALLNLAFAHNRNFPVSPNSFASNSSHHHESVRQNHSHMVSDSEICSKNASSKPQKLSKKHHNDNSCHELGACHACRIGASMLTPPDSVEIGAHSLFLVAILLPYDTVTFGTFFVKSNASPRSPPFSFIS